MTTPARASQNSFRSRVARPATFLSFLLLGASLTLTGCGVDLHDQAVASPDPTAAESVPGRMVEGNVHGGVYPIQGATIRLMQTSTGGYGAAATTLLTTTSDKNGNFLFPDTGWSCTLGQYAYITVTSGYTVNLGTTTPNNDVVQVGVIGPCSSLQGSAAIDKINVFVSELSTVAAAYALGNFIHIDNTNAASGQQIVNISAPVNNSSTGSCTVSASGAVSACTAAGLSHAFSLAAILVNSVNLTGSFPSGQAQFSNPNSPYSSIPAPMINTIGDILQNCVDSVGGSQCSSLFSNATPPGGTAPTNTLQAAMNMAKYPTNNASSLYNLISPAVPFTPDLASAPSAFTVSIFYGVTYNSSLLQYPIDVALDSADNAYVLYASNTVGSANNTYAAVDEISPAGKFLYQGAHNTNYLYPTQVAVDANSNVYITNADPTAGNDYVAMAAASKNGTLQPVTQLAGATGLAVDANSNLWVSSTTASAPSVNQYIASSLAAALASNGSTFVPAVPGQSSAALGAIYGLATDSYSNIWGTGLNSSSKGMAFYWANKNGGTNNAPSYAAGGGTTTAFSTTAPSSVAPSGANAAYFPFNDVLTSAAYAATLSAPNNGQITTGAAVPDRSEVDGAGTVFWTDRESTGLLNMYTPPASGGMSGGTLVSFLPCFAYPNGSSYNCITDSNTNSSSATYTPAYLRGMAIDSAGDLWCAADAGYGAVIETLGVAAPAWPLLSYGHPGVKPQ